MCGDSHAVPDGTDVVKKMSSQSRQDGTQKTGRTMFCGTQGTEVNA